MQDEVFQAGGIFYPYMRNEYSNERSIECPFVLDAALNATKLLEVGNCLRMSYTNVEWTHDTICKYDATPDNPNVHRVDILDWQEAGYDQIVSISTFEHLGKDYGETWQPEKGIWAVEHCQSLLCSGGELRFTIPVGWNAPYVLDEAILKNILNLNTINFMVRLDSDNNWIEKPLAEYPNYAYPGAFGAAGGVLLCTYRK